MCTVNCSMCAPINNIMINCSFTICYVTTGHSSRQLLATSPLAVRGWDGGYLSCRKSNFCGVKLFAVLQVKIMIGAAFILLCCSFAVLGPSDLWALALPLCCCNFVLQRHWCLLLTRLVQGPPCLDQVLRNFCAPPL